MLTDRHQLGQQGELLASAWLEQRGWRILARRFRSGHRDLDLVAVHTDEVSGESVIAFIEVRTRRSTVCGHPIETVRWQKQREIRRVAQAWLRANRYSKSTYRFDVVGVVLTPSGPEIEHVTNAF